MKKSSIHEFKAGGWLMLAFNRKKQETGAAKEVQAI